MTAGGAKLAATGGNAAAATKGFFAGVFGFVVKIPHFYFFGRFFVFGRIFRV